MAHASLAAKLKKHYLAFSTYTYPGLYKQKLVHSLPDSIREAGLLVRESVIHRKTLTAGNTGTNADLRFGDMTKVPWWRQPEDDILVTASAMLAELYRRDKRGFVFDRAPQDKLVLTCRYVSILIASILKSKDIPARARSGNAAYLEKGRSDSHWINQYWHDKEGRWVTIDVDGSLSLNEDFDPYDMPEEKFDWPARTWLDIRSGKVDPELFHNIVGLRGLIVVAWSLFYDFHSLMNNETIYMHQPNFVRSLNFSKLDERQLKQIDTLAGLMLDPDSNFDKLQKVWETHKDFRLLGGALL
jgi:hypothetical protein